MNNVENQLQEQEGKSSSGNRKDEKSNIERGKAISFTITSIIASLITLSVSLIDVIGVVNLNFLINLNLPSLPLLAWIGIGAGIYCIVGYLIEFWKRREGVISRIFRIPVWSELRNFGDQNVARVSYLGLIIIPLIAFLYDKNINGVILLEYFSFPENMKLIYFASWSFSLALLLFSIGCPKQIRKERKFDMAKNINLILHSVKDTKILVEDEKEEFPELDIENLLIRTLSFLFYLIGIVLTIIVLFRGATIVYNV